MHPLDPVIPKIRNVEALSFSGSMLMISFVTEAPVSAEGWKAIIYVDGLSNVETVDIADGEATELSIGPLAEGAHDIDIQIIRDYELAPLFLPDYQSFRTILKWSPSISPDVAGYYIYSDAGTGTVDYSSIVDTLDDTILIGKNRVLPDTGTGIGKITIAGNWQGTTPTNEVHTIAISSAGKWSLDGGDEETIYEENTIVLPGNLQLTFLNDPDDYDVGDQWTYQITPRNYWISPELDAGDYIFGVKGFDTAGNLSATPLEGEATITDEPNGVSEVTITYDDGTGDVVLTWTDGSGTTSYNIYTNYDIVLNTLGDYINEIGPVANVLQGAQTYTLSTIGGDLGTIKFYIRGVDINGVEEESITIHEIEAYSYTPSSLDPPFNLEAQAKAGGTALVSWLYDLRRGLPASFNLYEFTSEPITESDFTAVVPVSVSNSYDIFYGDIVERQYTKSADTGTKYFAVRAVDSSGNETKNLDSVSVVLDGTGPLFGPSAIITGGPL